MTNIVYVSIKDICFNRFQQAHTPDQAKIDEIASSLLQHRDNGTSGLLQVPTARIIEDDSIEKGMHELAFGHHRYLAFQQLAETDVFFANMPLIVRTLSDIEMFELMAIENFQRRDISPREEANTFHSYMTTFGKTSQQAADKFGKTDEYVRAAIRLLNLPEEALQLMDNGTITKTDARDLLVLKKLGGDHLVAEALVDIADPNDTDSPKEVILQTLRMSDQTQWLDSSEDWFAGKKYLQKHLKTLTREEAASVLEPADGFEGEEQLDEVMTHLKAGMELMEDSFPTIEPDSLSRLRVIANPLPCDKCPFHAVVEGSHYCGIPLCKKRKIGAWELNKVDLLVEKLGVPLYRKEDGAFAKLDHNSTADQKLWKEKGADLRIGKASYVWNNFDGLDSNWQAVVVGETAKKRLKKLDSKSSANKNEKEAQENEIKLRHLRREFRYRFTWEVASLAFSSAFDGINSPELLRYIAVEVNGSPDTPEGVDDNEIFEQTKKGKIADQLKASRRYAAYCLADRVANYHGDYGRKAIIDFAKDMQEEMLSTAGLVPSKEYLTGAERLQKEYDQALKELLA